jgi:DNA-binding NarL/FixJ family response regulator
VERALELRPDVVVMDVEMPVLDGVAAAGRLRRELPGARVIFVTGSADLELVTRARALGADSFVHKGRVFHELLDAVAAPMAAAASAA